MCGEAERGCSHVDDHVTDGSVQWPFVKLQLKIETTKSISHLRYGLVDQKLANGAHGYKEGGRGYRSALSFASLLVYAPKTSF